MKRIKLIFLGTVFAMGLNNVNAQLSVGGDLSGIRSMAEGSEFMFGGMLNVQYGITENIHLGVNFGFYQKSFGEIFGQKLSGRIMPITLSGTYFFKTDNIRPYSGLDVGLYNFGSKFGTTSSSEGRFGIAPVGGLQYGINENLFLNANFKYHIILDSDIDNLFSFNVGVGYRF